MLFLVDNRFCVYLHKLNDVIIYVGSGTQQRPYSKSGRQDDHLSIWKQINFEIVKSNLSIENARKLEQELILKYNSEFLLNRQKKVSQGTTLDYEMLSKFLYYDEKSSTCLRWKVKPSTSINIDDEAGHKGVNGYVKVTIKGRRFYAHRVIYCLVHKVNLQTTDIIDHIDFIKSNNLIKNLQLITASDNIKRSVPHKKSILNERNITEELNFSRFKVRWTENLQIKCLYFSYKNTRKVSTGRNYSTRNIALNAAIEFRDSLIFKKLIIVKESNENKTSSNRF